MVEDSEEMPKGKFWYVSGYYVYHSPFSFYLRKPTNYFGDVAKWYCSEFFTHNEWGYTLGKDLWETEQEAIEVAKPRLEKAIQREKEDHQRKMDAMLAHQRKLEG